MLKKRIRNFIFGTNILKYFATLIRLREFLKFNYKNLKSSFKWLLFKSEFTNYNYDITPLNRSHLACFLSCVTDISEREVLKIFEELELDQKFYEYVESKILKIKRRRELSIPFYYGRRLAWYTLIRILKPEVVVETGTDKGLGTLIMAHALQKNGKGKIFTIDSDPYSGSLIDLFEWSNIEILRGNSLALLESVESIDLFLHDSNHDPAYEFSEFVAIEKVLSDNSWVISDNSHISDSLLEWSRQQGREFIFFKEESINHWHPGDGIGLSIPSRPA